MIMDSVVSSALDSKIVYLVFESFMEDRIKLLITLSNLELWVDLWVSCGSFHKAQSGAWDGYVSLPSVVHHFAQLFPFKSFKFDLQLSFFTQNVLFLYYFGL